MTRSSTPALAYPVLTPLYDLTLELFGFGARFKDGIARLADVDAGEAVLDLGCGTGTLLRALAARQPAAHYTGLDPDPRVLAAARRRLPAEAGEVTLIRGYAQHLPLSDSTFDLVISTLIFHHLPDEGKRQAIAEVRRVLRPAGRFLLVDFGAPQTWTSRTLLRIGSVFDGRANLRANLAGALPTMLTRGGFSVAEVAPRHRGLSHLLCQPRPT